MVWHLIAAHTIAFGFVIKLADASDLASTHVENYQDY